MLLPPKAWTDKFHRELRVATAFDAVVLKAARKLPWLINAKLRYCKAADAEHAKSWRQFMHSNERPMTVCVAWDAGREMTDKELKGMIAHELGHLVGTELGFPEHSKPRRGKKTPQAVQDEADWIARNVLGFKIRYNRRTLQESP